MHHLLSALEAIAKIGEDGVIERRETGKPTWSALDAIKNIAREAIAKHTSTLQTAINALEDAIDGAQQGLVDENLARNALAAIYEATIADSEPPKTIESHNEPLRAAMFARGCEWKSDGNYENFTLNGAFEVDPVGYIRGPHYRGNGDPLPYQYSVQGPGGLLPKGFTSHEEGRKWALETAASVLNPPKQQIGTDQIRDIIANADHLELMVVRRQYGEIYASLTNDEGLNVDIQSVMVVVDQLASSDPFFVRLAKDLAVA